MPQWHGDRAKRKASGGRKRPYRGKRAFEMGRDPTATVVGKPRTAQVRRRGGDFKVRLFAVESAVVTDRAGNKSQKVRIVRVQRNPANIDYERRGVITRGALIETPLGIARVTSRPGQDGVVNAVLVQSSS